MSDQFSNPILLADVSIGPYLVWIAVLIGVVIVATAAIMLLRKRILDPSASGGKPNAGLLDELRALRDTGAISEQEYDAARRRMVQRIAADALDRGLPQTPAPSNPQAVRKPPAP